MTVRTLRKAENILRETGRPYEIVSGRKHFKAKLAGRVIAVIPQGQVRDRGRAWENFRASVQRAAKGITY